MSGCEHQYNLKDHFYEDHSGYHFRCQKCTEYYNLDVHTWDDVLEAFGLPEEYE